VEPSELIHSPFSPHRFPNLMLFWIALTITRPFGTSFRDLLTKAINRGGVEFAAVESSS
jgi:uncharacterized membrane-anchored protein